MGKDLDLDDVAHGHPVAERELSHLREENGRLKGAMNRIRALPYNHQIVSRIIDEALAPRPEEMGEEELASIRVSLHRRGAMPSDTDDDGLLLRLLATLDAARASLERVEGERASWRRTAEKITEERDAARVKVNENYDIAYDTLKRLVARTEEWQAEQSRAASAEAALESAKGLLERCGVKPSPVLDDRLLADIRTFLAAKGGG